MKKLLLPLLFLASMWTRADVVMEEKIEGTTLNGSIITRIKGDIARIDMPASRVGEVSIIIQLKEGQMTALIHDKKGFVKEPLDAAKKRAEAEQKAQGIDLSKDEQPKTTGQKENVGEVETEIFEGVVGGNKTKYWVAKGFPNYKPITAQLSRFITAMGTATFDPGKTDLGGMILKSETTLAKDKAKVTRTLVKAKDEPVEEAIFKAPEDYKPIEVDPAQK